VVQTEIDLQWHNSEFSILNPSSFHEFVGNEPTPDPSTEGNRPNPKLIAEGNLPERFNFNLRNELNVTIVRSVRREV